MDITFALAASVALSQPVDFYPPPLVERWAVPAKRRPHFAPCSYCQKAADVDQLLASCSACGAPLQEKAL